MLLRAYCLHFDAVYVDLHLAAKICQVHAGALRVKSAVLISVRRKFSLGANSQK